MTETWWEIEVLGTDEIEDLVFWALQLAGCLGTASFEREGIPVICGYLPASQTQTADLEILAQRIHGAIAAANFTPTKIRWHEVLQEDWAHSWKQYWQTEPIGERFLIHPDWLPDPDLGDRLLIRLDPGVAFGTGAHATTQLCLEALERQFAQGATGNTVADIGCGTGILGIGAIKLGAARVYGVDTDPLAVDSARAAVALNQISSEQVQIQQGSAAQLRAIAPVDGICCNILAEIIVSLLSDLTALAGPKTWAVFSGILERQAEEVISALKQQGWSVQSVHVKGDWCAIDAVLL